MLNQTISFFAFYILLLPVLQGAENYFIEIGKNNIEIGQYTADTYVPQKLASYARADYDAKAMSQLILNECSNEKVLFYIHSMWGGNSIYHKSSLQKLNELNPVDRIISIVWHTDHLGYKASWEKAIDQGKSIAPLIEELTTGVSNENYLLCHSMGHRLLEGMALEFKQPVLHFADVFLMAADLDIDVFDNNLKSFPQYADEIFIYVNQKDKWLQPSKLIHGKGRLGLNAGQHCLDFEKFPNINIVDVTEIPTPGLTTKRSHIYFKNNAMVMRDVYEAIAGVENESVNSEHSICKNYREIR